MTPFASRTLTLRKRVPRVGVSPTAVLGTVASTLSTDDGETLSYRRVGALPTHSWHRLPARAGYA